MATPAASAWHRRRHILSTPSARINTVQDSSSLTNRRIADFPPSAPPTSQLRAPASEIGWRRDRGQHLDSRWEPPDNILAPRSPDYRQPSFFSMISQLFSSLSARAHNFIYKCFLVTVAIILLGFASLFVADWVANYVSPCIHRCRHIGHLHRFSPILFTFRTAAALGFGITLFGVHFVLFKVVMKQMRSCKRQFHSRSVRDLELLKLRGLHAMGSVSGCVLQSICMAYALYGPAVTPISLTWSKCAPQKLALLNQQLIPDWSDLALHTLVGAFSGIFYAILSSMTVARATRSYPFHVSATKRVVLYAPRAILLSAIPALMAIVPAVVVQGLFNEIPDSVMPESGSWTKIVEWLAALFAAMWCSFLSLLSWNVISVAEEQFLGPRKSLTAEVGRASGHRDHGELSAAERAKFLAFVQQCASPKNFDDDDGETLREMLISLSFLTKPDVDMTDFPGFLDASGEVWRITLQQCLSPIDLLQELLREYNLRRLQKSSLRGSTAMFRAPTRSGVGSNSFFSTPKSFVFTDADMCIAACKIISTLLVVSYELDTYGVVHRTLAQAVQSLLLCKEQTEAFISARIGMGKDGRGDWFSLEDVGIFRELMKAMQVESDYQTIFAIDDAIKLALYRIIGTFRTHMYNFVNGNEVTWDRTLDRQLREFLDYRAA